MHPIPRNPLFRIRQERKRELYLGRRRIGNDARLCCDHDAVCPIHLLCYRLGIRHRIRAPDIHQDEHRRRRHCQVHCRAVRSLPFHYRSFDCIPGFLRISHITAVSV